MENSFLLMGRLILIALLPMPERKLVLNAEYYPPTMEQGIPFGTYGYFLGGQLWAMRSMGHSNEMYL